MKTGVNMTNTDAHAELVNRISRFGVELSELSGQLKRSYSNYEFIDPKEEPAFNDLWKGIVDIEQALEKNCHNRPPEARDYETEKTGVILVPVLTGDDLNAGYNWKENPWHYPRRVPVKRPRHYLVRNVEGDVTAHCEQRQIVKPITIPEGVELGFETGIPEGFEYVFMKDENEILRVRTENGLHFDASPIGIEKAGIIIAADEGLAPEIPQGSGLIYDEGISNYDGKGYYAIRRAKRSGDEIVQLEVLRDGGFSLVSYKARPEKLKDLSGIRILGKARYFLLKNGVESPFGFSNVY